MGRIAVSAAKDVSAAKTERLLKILALWNPGTKTASEIGAIFGMPRGSVLRTLWQARRRGYRVVRVSDDERIRRWRVSMGVTKDVAD